jgi:transmembrane sensor
MISKEQYVLLYEKYLQGQCTPEEMALLDTYEDEITLNGQTKTTDKLDEEAIQYRIWQRLQNHLDVVPEPETQKSSAYLWLKIAAVLVVAVSFALMIVKYTQVNKRDNQFSNVKGDRPKITAGGHNAYLTLADGTVISLNNAVNGELAKRSGIQITKAKDGMLVYKFINKVGSKVAGNDINTITTPRGGQYQVQLADGTKVWLNAETSIKFPVTFNTKHRDVELTGEAYFEVAKNKHQPFTVHANDTRVQVIGTHFNVSAYDRDAVSTTLLEGSVRLVSQNATAMLKPGQNGTTEQNKQAINVQKADIEQDMAWKNGYIIFNDADIKTVMKQASRWYNVDVEYQGNLSDQRYNGKISKYKDIAELLTNMELTGTVHFKIQGRRITVMK